MQFDGHNITEFLEEWNIECEDFGLTETQRCARFPNYCTPEIKETVKILPGYIASNWTTLQSDVKKLYWPKDKPENTMAALDKLIKEAPGMDLDVYVLKYTSISEALVAARSSHKIVGRAVGWPSSESYRALHKAGVEALHAKFRRKRSQV